jgi:hypothetical protein
VITKHNLLVRLIALSFTALLLIANVKAFAQDAAAQTKAEIERLRQSLKDKPVAIPDIPDLNSEIEGNLKGAAYALAAGRLYLRLWAGLPTCTSKQRRCWTG